MRRLEKRNGLVFGVCGGIADFLGWDATAVRTLFVVSTLFVGLGPLAYIVLVLIMPNGED